MKIDRKVKFSTLGKVLLVIGLIGMVAMEPLLGLLGDAAKEVVDLATSDSPLRGRRTYQEISWLLVFTVPITIALAVLTPLKERTGDALAWGLIIAEVIVVIIALIRTFA